MCLRYPTSDIGRNQDATPFSECGNGLLLENGGLRGLEVLGMGFRSRFTVLGLGFRVKSSGFRFEVQGLWARIRGVQVLLKIRVP